MEEWFDNYEAMKEFIKRNNKISPHMKFHEIVVEDEDEKEVQWIARQNHNGTVELREGEYLFEQVKK